MEEINRIASQFACKTPAERSSILKTAHEDMEMTIYRQNDLQQAALSPRAMENAHRIAKSAGFAEFAYHPVTSPDGKITGWLVNAAA